MYRRLIFPLLSQVDPETAHERTLSLLEYGQSWAGRPLLHRLAGKIPRQPVKVFGLTFPNVLGMAAGFDKDVRVAVGLAALGFGHVEVGTLTPRPQAGNSRPRIFRLALDKALINRMGFPNEGVETAVPRLKSLSQQPHNFVLGVSLGKQKETPLEEADQDYIAVMQAVYPYANYLAVNISSPNTPGLRDLQGGDYLGHLLRALTAENQKLAYQHQLPPRPLLVKIAPDLTWAELDEILTAVQDTGIDGIIAANTTLSRDGLLSAASEEAGGLSGRPLADRSTEIIAHIHRETDGRLPIIGVGGIFTAADICAKLDVGATLVQLYTALIYEGPTLPGRLLREMGKRQAG
ncbi:MAG: quinone-dependent dihydroorotate dehydrogenase [Chloroflexi bacterium]|nr:quinone-dependent dihydroorotate dehydrogenase [Ardenticatenaceae bacterium]MBL1130829.1 quinone-dependent dihydroorotate dehydrogenase [Chloroflexota bacterium]NOG36926.1 quinone-dependent dihydroorotate dehydrogenase [Chloroflexota bacterium]GIK57153.1 MAG: dihydroorotate dehydrogenase (quinone) [Chloroflexota bacterium]